MKILSSTSQTNKKETTAVILKKIILKQGCIPDRGVSPTPRLFAPA